MKTPIPTVPWKTGRILQAAGFTEVAPDQAARFKQQLDAARTRMEDSVLFGSVPAGAPTTTTARAQAVSRAAQHGKAPRDDGFAREAFAQYGAALHRASDAISLFSRSYRIPMIDPDWRDRTMLSAYLASYPLNVMRPRSSLMLNVDQGGPPLLTTTIRGLTPARAARLFHLLRSRDRRQRKRGLRLARREVRL